MSEEKKKNNLDEQALARVLEAAYVLQEHQDELEQLKSSLDLRRGGSNGASAPAKPTASPVPTASSPAVASPPPTASASPIPSPASARSATPIAASAPIASQVEVASSPTPVPAAGPAKNSDSVLALVMEIQHQVQVQQLDLDAAMSLIAEQVIEICGAAGAAIAIVNRRTVCYRSVAGIRTLPAGTEVPVDEALCASCLQSGKIWQCADTNPLSVRQREECRGRGIGSLIVAPLFHEGKSVGALELLFSDPGAFTEQDVHTCQLMAGIITEMLSRDLRWKDAPAANGAPVAETAPAVEVTAEQAAAEATHYQCYRCGHTLLGGEQFCGECGTPRSGDYEPASMQSKVASLWHMQESNKPEPSTHVQLDELPVEPEQVAASMQLRASSLNPPDRAKKAFVPHFGGHDETSDGTALVEAASADSSAAKPTAEIDAPAGHTNEALEELISSPPTPLRADWSSATTARDFLEQVAEGSQNVLLRLWNTRRGDIYLAVAVILVACVICWVMWSNHPESPKPLATPVASAPQKPAQPDLTLSERMLIAMGLADAPEPPAEKGNPSTQVWVDLHTALYYCPGADLYGKTATGKYTTQREAELDQFQPAYRKTCN